MFKNRVCILGSFGLATVLATFQKILGDLFSKSSGHPGSQHICGLFQSQQETEIAFDAFVDDTPFILICIDVNKF